jgi:5'-nucleotidase
MALIRRSTGRAALALLLALLAALSTASQRTEATGCVRITLLQVNDVYQFMPVDRGMYGGLARVSTLRKQVMEDSPHTLFLLSGDTISPSVESLKLKGQQMIDSWNNIGLDYAALGNHEFDFGPGVLLQRMKESKFQWLAANVFDKDGKPFGGMPPFVVREIGGVRIGFFGLLLQETMMTSDTQGVQILDPCETAQKVVPQLRAAGAQVVVAMTHLSMREDKQLAHCVSDIDLIIGGHEHTLLQSLANRTPIFKMTADARQLGRYDLTVDATTGRLQSIDWRIISVNNKVKDDPQFAAVTEKYKEFLRSYTELVGHSSVRLYAGSKENRTGETNVGNFVADSFRRAMGADAALINGGMIRADTTYEPGPLSKHDILSILPFGNDVVKIAVTGETLRKALENGVGESGTGQEPGRFPQVSGIRFSFDTRAPKGSRVTKIKINGLPLDDRKIYTLATTRYLTEGKDGYEMLLGARLLTKLKLPQNVDAEILRRAIMSRRAIAPRTDGRIELINKSAGNEQDECMMVAPAADK